MKVLYDKLYIVTYDFELFILLIILQIIISTSNLLHHTLHRKDITNYRSFNWRLFKTSFKKFFSIRRRLT